MRIGIEAERANNPQKTGVEHYAKQLILHLAAIDRQNRYTLYLRTQPEDWFLKLPENFTVKVLPFPIFWTQLRLSLELLLHPVDALLIPASALPLYHPKRSVVTIHDLAWRPYPETFTWATRTFLEWSTWFAVRFSRRLIAVSASTKADLVKLYGVPPEKVAVVHHGYEAADGASTGTQSLPKLPERFVMYLSTLQPRKNPEGLIEAFVQLKAENPDLPHKLVMVGKAGWKASGILDCIGRYPQHVAYLGHLAGAQRLEVLKKAECFVLPSFYEGFGMTILEAFACGVPVATARTSSMPEVAGEAALYFDPHRTDEIKNAMKAILFDQGLKDRLVAAGRRRLQDFSWERCARETLAVLAS